MAAAAVLLVLGGILMLGPGEGNDLLHDAGFGLIVLAGIVYLGARIASLVRERRA